MEEQNERLKIFKKLNRRLSHPNITKGVYIREDFTLFSEKKMFENRISMWLPDSFSIMPQEMMDMKYPYEQQPQVVWTSQDYAENISLNLTEQTIHKADFLDALIGYQILIKRSHPANIFYDRILQPYNNTMLGWFDFKSYSMDGEIYNLLFMTSIGEKLLFGVFNCIFQDYIEWETYIPQVLSTIKDMNSNNKKSFRF